eukprot:Gb_07820 [translate_table: standard]
MQNFGRDSPPHGGDGRKMNVNVNINAVFYANSYHPIQAGSIDGTDINPHDNGVYRALLCSSAGLYDPTGDPKVIGDPYCTLFVGRLSHSTTEETLQEAMTKYGRVKNLRLVRHIVTGASRGYAFVEYETEREMRHAYEAAYHSIIDGNQVIVDYNRQQLMPGWIPRRLGGGLGGQKESGQLRFGGRDRPFRAPLRPIPHEELKKLGIPLPPEGRYMSRFQIPPPPRRRSPLDRHQRHSEYRSAGLSRQHGDASEKNSSDLRSDREKPSKPSGYSSLGIDEQDLEAVSVAKESTRSFSFEDVEKREKATDREGSMHADNEEDVKHRSHSHHRHKTRKDRHTSHRHERKRKESWTSEHESKGSLNRDKVDDENWKRRLHEDDNSGYK